MIKIVKVTFGCPRYLLIKLEGVGIQSKANDNNNMVTVNKYRANNDIDIRRENYEWFRSLATHVAQQQLDQKFARIKHQVKF